LHTFLKEQPDLNWYNPHVREAMKAILHFWLEKGVDGFRTDAMHHLLYDPEFNDDPRDPKYDPAIHPQYGSLIHSNSQYANMLPEITQTFCEALDRPKKGFMFSESYIQIPEMERLYHACNNHLHAPLNFHLLKLPWSAATYRTFIDTFESSLSPDDIPTYVLGNHDTVRVATRLGQDRARVAAMLLLTLRGIPFIYYGDEIGMENAVVTKAQAHDPLTKTTLPNQPGRDGCRTPMQWSPSSYAGFSETRPWLPVATSYRQYNVESERSLPGSMLSLYAKLIHLRKQSPALTRGSYHSKTVSNPHIFSFIREYKKEKMVIILNFSPEAQIYTYTHAPGTILCSTYMDSADTIPHGKEIVLRASEGIIIHIT
jgi:alpha-glucosidase